jgi:hypothetical protein
MNQCGSMTHLRRASVGTLRLDDPLS